MNKINKINYRLLIQKVDRTKPILKGVKGETLIPFKWVEVDEISLGSAKYPNHDVLAFKYVPMTPERRLR